jgi:hypothetical protein
VRVELIDKPGVIVTPGGSEGYTGGTNRRDDVLYPFFVGLFTTEGDRQKDSDPPGGRPTLFREIVRRWFGNERPFASVAGSDCYLVQYEPQPPVYDVNMPGLEELSTACGVSVYARVPRRST